MASTPVAAARPSTPYPYAPIDPERQIRVVTLLPGRSADPICCRLSILAFGNSAASNSGSDPSGHHLEPQSDWKRYSALSYTWGSWNNSRTIVLNGQEGFPITRNLYAALRRLRKPHQRRRLWVDQICIAQDDTQERNHQVRLMGQVYREADRVIVWLGDIPEHVDSTWQRRVLAAANKAEVKWHTRAWVVQEFILADRSPTFLFGSSKASYDELLADQGDVHGSLDGLQEFLFLRRDFHAASRSSFLDCEFILASTSCADPRDKIYSLFSLISNDISGMIEVDYNQSVAAVYAQATRANIVQTDRLEILGWVRSSRARQGPDWNGASWVVDYRFVGGFFRQSLSGRNLVINPGDSQERPWLDQQGGTDLHLNFDAELQTMKLTGFRFDSLLHRFPDQHGWTRGYPRRLFSQRRRLAPQQGIEDAIQTALKFSDAISLHSNLSKRSYSKTEKANVAFLLSSRKRAALFAHAWFEAFVPLDKNDQDRFSPWPLYFKYLTKKGQSRLFITNHGILGVGPDNIAEKDVIVLPFGCRTPMLLRSKEQREWGFISFVYVFGIMKNELLKILPGLELEKQVFVIS